VPEKSLGSAQPAASGPKKGPRPTVAKPRLSFHASRRDPTSIKLISTDFDGTVFGVVETPPIPLVLQELLDELQAQGAKWVINTGRDMCSLMDALDQAGLSVQPDYLVLVEREIHVNRDSEYVSLEEWNRACVRDHAEVFARVQQDLPQIAGWINARFSAQIYEDDYSPFCLIAGTNPEADVIHEYLREYCRSVPDLTVVRNEVYARFSHANYNKGTALAEVSRRLGLTSAEVFAVGDHWNDLPMLSRKYARWLAAPANAVEVVKATVREQGGYVSELSHGGGVAEAIKHYIAGGQA
jgi:HAD superfamily hydrolase (TIGR01484 family)